LIGVRLDTKQLLQTLKNTVEYSNSFVSELKKSEPKLAKKLGDLSIEVFYDYLDGLARNHPGMLHHVYEWGQVGDPFGRLYELRMMVGKRGVSVTADFLESDVPSPSSNEPFYDKANIMEEGIPVVVTEKDAQVLFFEIDGEEFFRHGPIYIANPGGSATRGSFVKAFNDFYQNYFNKIYLNSIKFYQHFESPAEFSKNFSKAVRTRGNASRVGKAAALSWIQKAPGGNL
jgi:hypothetical protein